MAKEAPYKEWGNIFFKLMKVQYVLSQIDEKHRDVEYQYFAHYAERLYSEAEKIFNKYNDVEIQKMRDSLTPYPSIFPSPKIQLNIDGQVVFEGVAKDENPIEVSAKDLHDSMMNLTEKHRGVNDA